MYFGGSLVMGPQRVKNPTTQTPFSFSFVKNTIVSSQSCIGFTERLTLNLQELGGLPKDLTPTTEVVLLYTTTITQTDRAHRHVQSCICQQGCLSFLGPTTQCRYLLKCQKMTLLRYLCRIFHVNRSNAVVPSSLGQCFDTELHASPDYLVFCGLYNQLEETQFHRLCMLMFAFLPLNFNMHMCVQVLVHVSEVHGKPTGLDQLVI